MSCKPPLALILLLPLAVTARVSSSQENPELRSENEPLSYALGMDVGRQLAKIDVNVDPALFAKGLGDVMFGRRTLLTEEDARAAVAAMQSELKRRQWQIRANAGEDSSGAGAAFLAENAARDGVVTLPSGLQYKVIVAGTGRTPIASDTVEVDYRGTHVDGVELDSSVRSGKPAKYKVSEVIPGWREALELMPVGSKWQLFVPPQLAYGEQGAGLTVGPNETLVFEVKLLGIVSSQHTGTAPAPAVAKGGPSHAPSSPGSEP